MRTVCRSMRRSGLLSSALAALLWAPRLWAACDPPGERWIAIEFSRGLDPAFIRAVSIDVQAGYAEGDVCPSTVRGEAPRAVVRIEPSGPQRVDVSVDTREGGLVSHVSRNVDVAGFPRDSRAFAVALAVNELLRADWVGPAPAEVAASSTREAAPPAPFLAPERGVASPAARPGIPWRLSIGAALERFAGGQTFLGGDGSVLVPLASRFGLRLAAGGRQGLQTDAPHGYVRSRALSVASEATYYFLWNTPLELGLGLGAQGEWLELSGLAADANTSTRDLSGFAVYVRAGVSVAWHIASIVWLEAAAHAGVPLRGLEATDSGEMTTGASGLQLSVISGVSVEL